jgi:hypothetical protein
MLLRALGLVVVAIILALLLAGCDRAPPESLVEERVENIVRIVARKSGDHDVFELFIQTPGSTEVKEKYLTIKRVHRKFVADVPQNKNGWLLIKRDPKTRKIWYAELHIRSFAEVSVAPYRVQSGKTSYEVHPYILM